MEVGEEGDYIYLSLRCHYQVVVYGHCLVTLSFTSY